MISVWQAQDPCYQETQLLLQNKISTLIHFDLFPTTYTLAIEKNRYNNYQ